MRPLVALISIAALVAATSGSADAARKPTPRERADVTRAVLSRLEHDSPGVTASVKRVVVSTVLPRKQSTYSRFAAADAFGRDRAGRPVGFFRALVGFSRRYERWVSMDYGSSEVGCNEPQVFFAGRRAAILRDLGLECP
jgi:hypothetical protein